MPTAKPGASRGRIETIVAKFIDKLEGSKFVMVACRGYYRDTMGKPGVNDRGIYDDAIFFIAPDCFMAFNANVDPSIYRMKIATVAGDQVIWYRKGLHGIGRPPPRCYPAFRQSRPLIVERDDGKGGRVKCKPDWPFTNLHRGGVKGTSSEGCLTIPPSQWDAAKKLGYELMTRHGQKEVPCILVEMAG